MQAIEAYVEPTSADLLERILDKGIVIDAWAMVTLAGLDVLSIQARVVVASIQTYVNYAEPLSLTASGARPPIEQLEEK